MTAVRAINELNAVIGRALIDAKTEGRAATLAHIASLLAAPETREAVARALCESVNPGTSSAFSTYRDDWLRDATAALAAVGEVLGCQSPASGEGGGAG